MQSVNSSFLFLQSSQQRLKSSVKQSRSHEQTNLRIDYLLDEKQTYTGLFGFEYLRLAPLLYESLFELPAADVHLVLACWFVVVFFFSFVFLGLK